jgi:cytochrome c-type biogenesis protein CcmI
MQTLALALAALLAVVAVLAVALPFLGRPQPPVADGAAEAASLALLERRDRALAALKELEFDHRTGKISDDDHRSLVGTLRREALETIRQLEPEQGAPRGRGRSKRQGRRPAALPAAKEVR